MEKTVEDFYFRQCECGCQRPDGRAAASGQTVNASGYGIGLGGKGNQAVADA